MLVTNVASTSAGGRRMTRAWAWSGPERGDVSEDSSMPLLSTRSEYGPCLLRGGMGDNLKGCSLLVLLVGVFFLKLSAEGL